MYDNLLDFYFEAVHILSSKRFVWTLARSGLNHRLPDIIGAFAQNTELLDRAIAAETYRTVKKLDTEHVYELGGRYDHICKDVSR